VKHVSHLVTLACAAPVKDLFVYGTLMDVRIQRQILGRALHGADATLFGYRRVQNPGSYPYVVSCLDARVRGRLLRRLSARDLALLDYYEDEGVLYERRRVTVRVAAVTHEAWVYVGIAARLQRVRAAHFDGNRRLLMGTT